MKKFVGDIKLGYFAPLELFLVLSTINLTLVFVAITGDRAL